jgi:hypothetical protein
VRKKNLQSSSLQQHGVQKLQMGIRQGSPEQSDTALSYFITTAKIAWYK